MTSADALAAGLELAQRLEALADRGRLTPCQVEPDAWFAEHRSAQAAAAEACGYCPLLEPCREYADAVQPSHGVWAGVPRQDRPPKRRPRTDQTSHDEGAAA